MTQLVVYGTVLEERNKSQNGRNNKGLNHSRLGMDGDDNGASGKHTAGEAL